MIARPYDDQAEAAARWLASLRPRTINGRSIPGDRAALAKLRRSSCAMDAVAEPVTADLFKQINFERTDRNLLRCAVIAAVLAHVGGTRPDSIARSIGTPRAGDGSTALVTPLRLKRLLAAREPDDVLIAFRRVVARLGGEVNVKDLARQILAWTDEERGDISRTQFAFEYHGAGQFGPGADDTPATETADKD
jgi:CRISPR system Cascade subunit CasB